MKTFEVLTPLDQIDKIEAHQVLIHTNGCLIFWDDENRTVAAYSPDDWCRVLIPKGEGE